MYDYPWISPMHGYGPAIGGGLLVILLLIVWTLLLKGLALWHAARRSQPWWFGILLIVNTFGILELIYLFGVAKIKSNELFAMKK